MTKSRGKKEQLRAAKAKKTKAKQEATVSYHPTLPSTQQAKKDYSKVTSDHVPIVADVPIDEDHQLRVISWNVLHQDHASGFADIGQMSYNETDEQTQDRYQKIARSLKRMVKEQNPDLITLQEISNKSDLLRIIMQELGPDWGFAIKDAKPYDAGGVITLFNKKTLKEPDVEEKEPKEQKKRFRTLSGGDAINITQFVHVHTDKAIRILNPHAAYSPLPAAHEKDMNDFIAEKPDAISIVSGDFNCGVAATTQTPSLITTSVAPPMFRGKKSGYSSDRQGGAAIDGCFYSTDGTELVQASFTHLNPATGKKYTAEELKPIDLTSVPADVADEIAQPRIVMSADKVMIESNPLLDDSSLREYEEYLRSEFQTPDVIVRPARDLNNNQYIAVAYKLEKSASEEIKQNVGGYQAQLGGFSHVVNDSSGEPYTVFYVSTYQLANKILKQQLMSYQAHLNKNDNSKDKKLAEKKDAVDLLLYVLNQKYEGKSQSDIFEYKKSEYEFEKKKFSEAFHIFNGKEQLIASDRANKVTSFIKKIIRTVLPFEAVKKAMKPTGVAVSKDMFRLFSTKQTTVAPIETLTAEPTSKQPSSPTKK